MPPGSTLFPPPEPWINIIMRSAKQGVTFIPFFLSAGTKIAQPVHHHYPITWLEILVSLKELYQRKKCSTRSSAPGYIIRSREPGRRMKKIPYFEMMKIAHSSRSDLSLYLSIHPVIRVEKLRFPPRLLPSLWVCVSIDLTKVLSSGNKTFRSWSRSIKAPQRNSTEKKLHLVMQNGTKRSPLPRLMIWSVNCLTIPKFLMDFFFDNSIIPTLANNTDTARLMLAGTGREKLQG